MEQIIVNVGGLPLEEKKRVNEALAKIKGIEKLSVVSGREFWMYAPCFQGSSCVGWDPEQGQHLGTHTHTVKEVLEMAGMSYAPKRKVRANFNKTQPINVNVSNSTHKQKCEVQQAFFDLGIFWSVGSSEYKYLDALQYSNIRLGRFVAGHLMTSNSTDGCNISAEEFLGLVYEDEETEAENWVINIADCGFSVRVNKKSENEKMDNVTEFDYIEYKTGKYSVVTRKGEVVTQLTQLKLTGLFPLVGVVGGSHTGMWTLGGSCNATAIKLDGDLMLKHQTHLVHGVEIPDLRITPKEGEPYYYPCPYSTLMAFSTYIITADWSDNHRLDYNLCYEDSEAGKEAAILHAKAWLGIKE